MMVLRLLALLLPTAAVLAPPPSESSSYVWSKDPLPNSHLPPEYWANWSQPYFCRRGNTTCWPTESETLALEAELIRLTPPDKADMSFEWKGFPNPQPSAVPANSKDNQPLYGLGANGKHIKQLYVVPEHEANRTCFEEDTEYRPHGASEYCNAAVRNNEFFGWNPAFIVFPVVEEQVRVALQFAADHDLCISVVATGHEYLNRHSCPDGLMIRVSLMQHREFIRDWPDWEPGALKLGPGNTFSSILEFSQRFVCGD